MNQDITKIKGAQYRKADLHIHTPVSKCYKDKNIGVEAIISEAMTKGLKIIAITDHNDISNIATIQAAAKEKDIFVFPGIEITAAGGHIVAIFDLDYPLNKLNDLLPKVGIEADKRGKEDAIGYDFERVVDEIINAGGIAIAAHANSSNGLLQHPQGSYKLKIFRKPDLSALELTDREDIEKFSQGKIHRYPPKPCIQGSDAHSLSEIGQRLTYFKMDVVSIEGIRQALLDYEVKVRFEWDIIQITYPYIKKLSVSQGFFGEASFEFHPNLNCFIGGKNVGKSTIIEFLRYCFNDISSFEDIKQDTLGKITKLIGPGGIISVTYIDESGEELIIKRNIVDPDMDYEESPVIKTPSGEDTVISSKPMFFSQGEIFRITSSPIAQIELIDRYIQLEEENSQEERLMNALQANAGKLIEAENRFKKLTDEINNPEIGKLVTKTQYVRLEKALVKPIFTEFPRWESEDRFIKSIIVGIDNLKREIQESLEQIDIDNLFPQTLDIASPNYTLLGPLIKIRELMEEEIKYLSRESGNRLKIKIKEIQTTITKWHPLFAEKKKKYEKTIEATGEKHARDAQARLRSLRKRLDELEGKEKEAISWNIKIEECRKERLDFLKLLKEARKRRFEKRLTKVKEWESAFNSQIKVEIIYSGDKKEYIERLKVLLTGSYIYDRDIEKITKIVDPDNLIAAVINNQPEVLATSTELATDLVKRLVERLRGKQLHELYELEIVNLPDFPQIKFEIEPGKVKPLNELSGGTKSTIIVSIAMIEGKAPLIIDQPEESLDTQFIYDQIVKKLRQEKEKRQFIFTTYNPNIVVSADAELNFILSASADKGEIRSSGGIDRLDTNKLILLHLEGGEDAFKLRTQKYIIKG